MTSSLDTSSRSAGDRARSRAYAREFVPGIVGYVVVLAAAIAWGGLDGSSPWRYVWAVLPVVPALFIAWATLRHLRRLDDYQRLLHLQGLAVGFCVAMIASLTLAFLGMAGLPMRGAGWIVYVAGMGAWLVAGSLQDR